MDMLPAHIWVGDLVQVTIEYPRGDDVPGLLVHRGTVTSIDPSRKIFRVLGLNARGAIVNYPIDLGVCTMQGHKATVTRFSLPVTADY